MSLLCIDVENTHTTVGVFAGDVLVSRWLFENLRVNSSEKTGQTRELLD